VTIIHISDQQDSGRNIDTLKYLVADFETTGSRSKLVASFTFRFACLLAVSHTRVIADSESYSHIASHSQLHIRQHTIQSIYAPYYATFVCDRRPRLSIEIHFSYPQARWVELDSRMSHFHTLPLNPFLNEHLR